MLITCIFNLKYYHIKLILMLILGNYDACSHSFMNFLHWHAILLKFTFLHYSGLIMCDGELFQNMNTRVPSEPILLLSHEFEKLSIY